MFTVVGIPGNIAIWICYGTRDATGSRSLQPNQILEITLFLHTTVDRVYVAYRHDKCKTSECRTASSIIFSICLNVVGHQSFDFIDLLGCYWEESRNIQMS